MRDSALHIFRLDNGTSISEFQDFLKEHPDLEVIDRIESQLSDYIESLYPHKKFSTDELSSRLKEHLGAVSLYDYGCWVYYPWRRQVIHLLDEKEFSALRTDRNKNKITAEEQELLSHKKIGLIGLSVGHAVALTLALERSFGELRIADHDHLDLSNLNRIRSGVYNIGIPKTTMVMREIAELDPFLKVSCFDQGITDDNLISFLEDGGRLDLLIDECDSIDVKLQCREKARELGIPVLMETSDRGMLDVERFDLDSETPILHGHLTGVDSSRLKGLSNEQKIPYVLPIIGLDKSSLRLRTSMFEVEKTISTWPQLGSDVMLGGGTVANVARRILLKENIPTGRSYVDLLEIIPNMDKGKEESVDKSKPSFSEVDVEELILKIKESDWTSGSSDSSAISKKTLADIIEKASLAPSGGNTQPWLWHVIDNDIFLFLDTRKPFAFLDFRYRGSMVALGAASKNLIIASSHAGLKVDRRFYKVKDGESFPLVASFSLTEGEVEASDFYEFLEKRLTNRLNEGRNPLPVGFAQATTDRYNQTAVNSRLRIIDRPDDIQGVKEVLSITDRLVMLNEKGHRDLFGELKWNPDFSEKEGINVHALGLTPSELAGMQIAKDPKVIESLRALGGGERFSEMNHKAIDSSSAIGMITIKGFETEHFFEAGMDIQDHWLDCTSNKISIYPFTGGIYLINRVVHGDGEELNKIEIASLLHCEKELKRIFAIADDEVMGFLFRYSLNTKQPIRSNRKPLDEIVL